MMSVRKASRLVALVLTSLLFAGLEARADDCTSNPESCDQRLNNAAASSSANQEYVFETLLKTDWGLRKDEQLLKKAFKGARKKFEAADVKGLLGNWSGAYVCQQGKTGLTLHLEHKADKTVQGVFRFFPLSTEHTGVKKGAFAVQVLASKDYIFIDPREWLEQPEGYVTVGMVGKLDNNGAAFVGEILLPVCSNFALVKPK